MSIDNRVEKIVGIELNRFYQEHGLGDKGGEDASWAKVQMGWFNFYFPNTASRKRALFFHDVHHLATGYGTDLRGEAEIGAWEIASGCRNFWAAWVLNFMGFVMGLFIAPLRTFRAFVRGRNSRNFYQVDVDRETIERSSVGQVQELLELTGAPVEHKVRLQDVLWFGLWTAPVVALIVGIAALIMSLI